MTPAAEQQPRRPAAARGVFCSGAGGVTFIVRTHARTVEGGEGGGGWLASAGGGDEPAQQFLLHAATRRSSRSSRNY